MRKTLRFSSLAASSLLAIGTMGTMGMTGVAGLLALTPAHAQQSTNAPGGVERTTSIIGTGITLSSDWSNQTVTFFTSATANDDGQTWDHFYDVNTVIGDPQQPYTADWDHAFGSGRGSRDYTYRWRRDVHQSDTETMDRYLASHGISTWQLQLQHADDPNKVGPTDVKHVKMRLASPDGRFQLVISATYVDEAAFNTWVAYTADFLASLPEGTLEGDVRSGNLPVFLNAKSVSFQVAYADGNKLGNDADSFTPIIAPATPLGQSLPSPLGNVSGTGGS